MALTMPTLRRSRGTEVASTQNNQVATFTRLVAGAVTLIVGVLIFNEIEAALPDSGTGIDQTAIVGDIATAMELAPIVLLVIVAALVLAQVSGFGGNR
ncbi:MAG: hypothetical protein RI531_08975 [Haloferacaceae archaeon]|nr:hypothetical protein [Haloferacaceae archaeon]